MTVMYDVSEREHLAAAPSSGLGGDEHESERTAVRERTRAGANAGMGRPSERVL
jgi:hypothetical protein